MIRASMLLLFLITTAVNANVPFPTNLKCLTAKELKQAKIYSASCNLFICDFYGSVIYQNISWYLYLTHAMGSNKADALKQQFNDSFKNSATIYVGSQYQGHRDITCYYSVPTNQGSIEMSATVTDWKE